MSEQSADSEYTGYTALWHRLDALQRTLRGERRGLDAADVVVARDCVEVLRDLLVEIRGHHCDSQHLHDKGVYPKPRLADVKLYEAAGLPPLRIGDQTEASGSRRER